MDIEGTMQFILDHQAKFSSDIARIESVLQRTSEILTNLAERQNTSDQIIQEVRETMLDVANAQERTNEILATLAERQVATDGILATHAERQVVTDEILATHAGRQVAIEEARLATEEAIRRLAERQATTEENLNVLLLTVERHIANHN
jgi:hypothetical protein